MQKKKKWYFVTKIVFVYCEKKCSSDRKKLLKFTAMAEIFQKFWDQYLKQFIQTVKGQSNFWEQNAFLTSSSRFLLSNELEQL